MKILLLGDYSNYHACLAVGLRRLGHTVVVASDGSKGLETNRDITLHRPFTNKLGGALLYAQLMTSKAFTGYDVVSLLSPTFVNLRPERLIRVYKRLKNQNGALFLTEVGTDKVFMDMVTAKDCPLRYTEYFNEYGSLNKANEGKFAEDRLWQSSPISDFCEYLYNDVKGITSALYEYHLALQRRCMPERIQYIGIPIDVESVKQVPLPMLHNGKINIFLGRDRNRMSFKGTDRLEKAARSVVEKYPDMAKLTIVENLPYQEYLARLQQADIVLDQIYSYTPATNALLAMSMGKAVVSGAEPEYYDFIGERDNHPIFNALPDDNRLFGLLEQLVLNPELVVTAASQGTDFVRKHNDCTIVAKRASDFWYKNI